MVLLQLRLEVCPSSQGGVPHAPGVPERKPKSMCWIPLRWRPECSPNSPELKSACTSSLPPGAVKWMPVPVSYPTPATKPPMPVSSSRKARHRIVLKKVKTCRCVGGERRSRIHVE